jgi:hypothetical protein
MFLYLDESWDMFTTKEPNNVNIDNQPSKAKKKKNKKKNDEYDNDLEFNVSFLFSFIEFETIFLTYKMWGKYENGLTLGVTLLWSFLGPN